MAEKAAQRLRVLVVEDDPATLSATLALLELQGHWATGVTTAEAAIDRFMERSFDILFLDVNLPGLSGRELAEKLRNRERLPVIFASGEAPAQPTEGTVWLSKPYTAGQVQDALEQCQAGS